MGMGLVWLGGIALGAEARMLAAILTLPGAAFIGIAASCWECRARAMARES